MYFGSTTTGYCVNQCSSGYFGDVTNNNLCVTSCKTTGYYADTITNTCVDKCSSNYYG